MNIPVSICEPNACPPQYRSLTPQAECRLRGQRLGTVERPGRLPGELSGCGPKHSDAQIRRNIVSVVGAGEITRTDLRQQLGWKRQMMENLDGMVADGSLIETCQSRTRIYRLPQ